ncbi:MAG: hypothetical protein HFI81_04210 [Eubacterium sp.]|nr:hypothetical protein [Eubacterium sp.]
MKNIDNLLKQALTPTDEPDIRLKQTLLSKAKEDYAMKRKKFKAAAVAASVAVALGIGSVSIYAARKFLLPEHVTQEINDSKLTAAFQSEDAITINESQTYGGYRVTLMGIVSGKAITEYEMTGNDGVHDDRTYAVVSIERSDQTPMPSTSDDSYGEQSFFTSFLIQGLNPALYNAFTFGGGYVEIEENGVLYRLTECDNIEIFADREIYMCVSDGWSYNSDAYSYDETSGVISRNETYDGLNALFTLSLDASKADPAAAEEYIKKIDNGTFDQTETEIELNGEEKEVSEFINKLTPENLNEYAVPIEDSKQTLTPDKDGVLSYEYNLENGTGGSGTVNLKDLFPDQIAGTCNISDASSEGTVESIVITTFTLNEDGTVTLLLYVPK